MKTKNTVIALAICAICLISCEKAPKGDTPDTPKKTFAEKVMGFWQADEINYYLNGELTMSFNGEELEVLDWKEVDQITYDMYYVSSGTYFIDYEEDKARLILDDPDDIERIKDYFLTLDEKGNLVENFILNTKDHFKINGKEWDWDTMESKSLKVEEPAISKDGLVGTWTPYYYFYTLNSKIVYGITASELKNKGIVANNVEITESECKSMPYTFSNHIFNLDYSKQTYAPKVKNHFFLYSIFGELEEHYLLKEPETYNALGITYDTVVTYYNISE